MSQDLVKQNKMLKEYVEVLERQNNSRNIEKDVLLREIDNLTQENDDLRKQVSRAKQTKVSTQDTDALIRNKQQLQSKLRELQSNLEKVTRNKSEVETENAKLKVQVNNLNTRYAAMQTTNNELLKSKNETEQLKRQSIILSGKQVQITRLEAQVKQLREQITKGEEKYRTDLKQNQTKSFQISQFETEKLKQSMKKQLQKQSEEEMIKITTYFNDTLQRKENIILELESKLNQLEREARNNQTSVNGELNKLRITKRQLESKIQMAERQKGIQERRFNQLQIQVSQKTILLNKRQAEQEQLKNVKAVMAKKQEQIMKSASIIQALKNNVTILERKAKDLEQQTESSRERNNIIDSKKQSEIKILQAKYLRQIEQLKQKLELQQKNLPTASALNQQKRISSEKQRENLQLKKIINELSQNNNNLLQKLKTMQEMQEISYSHKVQAKDIRNEGELRNVVDQLRRQLTTVKSEFKKIEQDNKRMENFMSSRAVDGSNFSSQKAYPNVHDTFNRNLQRDRRVIPSNQISGNLSFKSISYNDEPNVKHSKLVNGPEKYKPSSNQDIGKSMNRDKWELLQRRISQLRQENAELKQSLYP